MTLRNSLLIKHREYVSTLNKFTIQQRSEDMNTTNTYNIMLTDSEK